MRVLSNQKYTIAEAYPTLLQAVRMRSNNDDNDDNDYDDDQRSQFFGQISAQSLSKIPFV